jgi:hypothetical protein
VLHSELLLRVEALKLHFLNHDVRSAVTFSERPSELTSSSSEEPSNRKLLQSTSSDYSRQHNLKYSSTPLRGSFKKTKEFFAILHASKLLIFTYCRHINCCKFRLTTDITTLQSRKREFPSISLNIGRIKKYFKQDYVSSTLSYTGPTHFYAKDQVLVSANGRSLVQTSPTECVWH